MILNKKLEIEFCGEYAHVRLNGEEIPSDEIEIERCGKMSVVRIRQVHVVNDVKIIGEPQGNYLSMESHDADSHQIIAIGINR